MDTIVLKFGGSSVSDDISLNIVAQKIIEFKQNEKNIVVVVSAQGKTTDIFIEEAERLADVPNEREMDVLLSTGEQITASKLSILLNQNGYPSISLTGWQVGIETNDVHKNAKIEKIYIERLNKELRSGKIVVVAGFQGITKEKDITTLGRGGSDTTAVAIAAALNAKECYIFSDVDGVYSADPKLISNAKKLDKISFNEMKEIADAGAKVLHNRCIEIGEKFNTHIITESTFLKTKGTEICKEIENAEVKSIVKNTNLIFIKIQKKQGIKIQESLNIYKELLKNNVMIEKIKFNENIELYINKSEKAKFLKIMDMQYPEYNKEMKEIVKLSVIGYGISRDNNILNTIIGILENDLEISAIDLSQSKIEIILNNISDETIYKLHKELIP